MQESLAQTGAPHAPVMLAECLEHLDVQAGRWYIDGTFGAGGHTNAILAAGGRVLALDRDASVSRFLEPEALRSGRLLFAEANFSELAEQAEHLGLSEVAGVLLDLGVSSMQLDEAERGFSFIPETVLTGRLNLASLGDIIKPSAN